MKYTLFFILMFLFSAVHAQDEEDKFNPYYGPDVPQKYNSNQIDFSKEFYNFFYKKSSKLTGAKDATVKLDKYDAYKLWTNNDKGYSQNGVLGANYQRIQIHFDKVTKKPGEINTYSVEGRSKVKNNICNFTGEIKIIKAYSISDSALGEPRDYRHLGVLYAEYFLNEKKEQSGSGVFTGILESYYYLDLKNKLILLNDSWGGDDYVNNTFVGMWTDYKTGKEKKCIWGDQGLPYVFDFDIKDGAGWLVQEKYVNNGWVIFNNAMKYYDDDKEEKKYRDIYKKDQLWWKKSN